MTLSVSNIEEIVNSMELEENALKKLIILLAAINDWPLKSQSLEEFITQLELFTEGTSDKKSLENTLENIDYRKDAWAAESITQLLELYHFYNSSVSLGEIITDLKQSLLKQ